MRNTGVVTEDCYAYSSGQSGYTGDCKLSGDECPSSSYVYPQKYSNVYGAYSINSVYYIMKELYTKGPVETALEVCDIHRRRRIWDQARTQPLLVHITM